LPRTKEQLANYKNPDNDPRGPWLGTPLTRGEYRERDYYPLTNPAGNEVWPPEGSSWRRPRETIEQYEQENRLWWGKNGDSTFPFIKVFLSEVKEGVVPITWWDYGFAGSTRQARAEIKGLFEGARGFETPKPLSLIHRMLQIGTDSESLVVDFFAGSCTTAQAVMEINKEDSGARTYIMVQIPESIPDESPIRKAGFETIADIGKERIRRVIARMKTEREGQLPLETRETSEDLGFKVFKLAPSTFRQWDPPEGTNAEALERQLSYFDRGLEEGADPRHVIYEVILKEGYSLNARIEPLEIESNQVYRVTDEEAPGTLEPAFFYICLDDAIRPATVDALSLDKETVFICLDTALDDSQKVNLSLQCLLKVI
jgi:adenine-specific DNA-methyltransferase